jgi:hypothetical protein
MPAKLASRQFAIEQRLPRYSGGRPCPIHGEVERYTSDGNCVKCHIECTRKRKNERYANDPEWRAAMLQHQHKRYERIGEEINKRIRERRATDHEWREAQSKRKNERYANDPEWREAQNKAHREWKKSNLGKVVANVTARKKKIKQASLGGVFKNEIQAIYIEAARLTKDTGQPWHVDHIFPIKGELSSGLHVPWNLRIIPAVKNLKRGNRIKLDLFNELFSHRPAEFDAAMEHIRQEHLHQSI